MLTVSPVFAYMAPQPYLPGVSVLVVVIGVFLMFGRKMLRLASRWVRPKPIPIVDCRETGEGRLRHDRDVMDNR